MRSGREGTGAQSPGSLQGPLVEKPFAHRNTEAVGGWMDGKHISEL